MPRTQFVLDGEGTGNEVSPGPELGVLAGVAGAEPDGEPLGAPLLGAPPVEAGGAALAEVGLAVELLLGWAEGLADGFLAVAVARLPGVPGVVPAGLVTPPPALAPPAVPDEAGLGTRVRAGLPVAGGLAGACFPAGALLNTPETTSATRPTVATTAAPAAMTPVFLRRGGFCWLACDGRVGSDMRAGTFHSSEPGTGGPPVPLGGRSTAVFPPLSLPAPIP
jgi:hypothetical protein